MRDTLGVDRLMLALLSRDSYAMHAEGRPVRHGGSARWRPPAGARRLAWTLSILVAALTGGAPAAGVYRWVDERGRVHYTDQPPGPDTARERVKVAPSPAVDPELSARRQRQQRFLDAVEEERARQRAEAETRHEEARHRTANCRRVRRSLRQFERGGALYLEDENGDRRYLDDEERARSLSELQRLQRTWCGR